MAYRSTPHGGMFNVHWHCLLFNVQRYESSSGPQWSSIPIGSIHMSSITSPHVVQGYRIVLFCQYQSSISFFLNWVWFLLKRNGCHIYICSLDHEAQPVEWKTDVWHLFRSYMRFLCEELRFFYFVVKKKRKLKTKSNYNVCLWCEVISFELRL